METGKLGRIAGPGGPVNRDGSAMIPAEASIPKPRRWQELWREAVTDPLDLLRRLGLESLAAQVPAVPPHGFRCRVPLGFIARMRYGDPADPLLRQVLPLDAELADNPGFVDDAVGDLDAIAAQGVLHKYEGRALVIATGACAINCRYCFRRHFPYPSETAMAGRWRAALDAIAADHSIEEVILSGGDPLSLATSRLGDFTDGLRAIPHVRRLRIHSRLPVVLPERVDAGFHHWLSGLPWPRVLVVHANHANELDDAVAAACGRLIDAGATVLNQSVLLRGVNDSVEALAALSRRLIECRVVPYYLHQLDRVRGASHFEVPDTVARGLVESLRGRLPGYLVPRLVREVPGMPSKQPL